MAARRDPGSLDPRLKYKRPASQSSDGNGNSIVARKRPYLVSRISETANVVGGPNGNTNSESISAALSDLLRASTAMARLEIKLEAAQLEYDRTAKDYDRLGEKVFPAMREQKRMAKQRAEEKLRRVNADIQAQQGPQGTQRAIAEVTAQIEKAAMPAPVVEKDDAAAGLESRRLQSLEKEVSDLRSTIETLESKIGSIAREPPETNGASGIASLAQDNRILVLESKLDSLATTESLNELREDYQDELKATLDLVDSNMNVLIEAQKGQFAPAVEELHAQHRANSEAQRQAGEAVSDCLKRLKNLEASEIQKAGESSAAVQQTIAAIEKRLKKLEKSPMKPAQNPGLLGFQPCLPDTNGDNSPQTNGARPPQATIDRIKAEIEMLKGITSTHTRIMNNLTTDEVVRCMVGQMSIMYPDAKNYQASMQEVRQKLTEVQSRIDTTSMKVGAVLNHEVVKLRADLVGVKESVDKHDKAVKHGQDQLATMATRVQQNMTDLMELQKDMIEGNDLIEELPRKG